VQILANTVLHLLPDKELVIEDDVVIGPGTGQDGSRSNDEDGDQRVTASRAGPRIIDRGEVGEEVRRLSRSELVGRRELGSAQRDRG
jgi:hypothetical protein